MTKIQKINESDFDFNKTTTPSSNYLVERLVAVGFIISFLSVFINSHNTNYVGLNHTSPQSVNQNDITKETTKYPDYVITSDDQKLFEAIFNYTTSSPMSKNSDIQYFNDSIRKDDLSHADFVNKDTKDPIIITSKILSVDSADKNQIMKEEGFPNLDYVDMVVQKTYQKGKEVYFEQQMVNIKMENHKIIILNTHRMID